MTYPHIETNWADYTQKKTMYQIIITNATICPSPSIYFNNVMYIKNAIRTIAYNHQLLGVKPRLEMIYGDFIYMLYI